MLFCQLPGRFCFYMRTWRLVRVVTLLLLAVSYCEFFHYYMVLLLCTWPSVSSVQGFQSHPLRAMFIGDTHILGSNAHWFDKLRREWMMTRSFQASMLIHSPDVVFVLGDLMDYGTESSSTEFEYHVQRFKRMFSTPFTTRTEIIVGNHDIGFHHMINDKRYERFKEAFSAPSVRLISVKDVIFVMVNSMALHGDGCSFCKEAEDALKNIKWQLKCSKGKLDQEKVAEICEKLDIMNYSRPILLQHFPLYRTSDSNCSTPDAAPLEEIDIPFRIKTDCLSKESTDLLFELLNPRLVVSAHTHHGCYRLHDNGIPEYTVASYNWRNKHNPTFFLAELTDQDFIINRCSLPDEHTVFTLYAIFAILLVIVIIIPPKKQKPNLGKSFTPSNKDH
ncbi:metallophosphoesterase 1-like isoform X2 [Dreissena polymorpha]|nr:metallophosphoesterase 1-like isoform X2 [Dreissena polymorpha]XP_052229371.1 metallophosphoesterase 1-like isoform X2 [Dreissena polymorpha]